MNRFLNAIMPSVIWSECPKCNGTGLVEKSRKITGHFWEDGKITGTAYSVSKVSCGLCGQWCCGKIPSYVGMEVVEERRKLKA